MEKLSKTSEQVISALLNGGADKAFCTASYAETREFNVDGGEFSLFRTLFDNSVTMTAFQNNKKGSIAINKLDPNSIKKAAADCLKSAESAEADPCWEISDRKTDMRFEEGVPSPDMDKFFSRLRELMDTISQKHPLILMEQLIASHTKISSVYLNSNGVRFETEQGYYSLELMYSAHEGNSASSFFSSYIKFNDLDTPLISLASIEKDLSDVEKQLNTIAFEGKFTGTVIMPPSCLGEMMGEAVSNFAGDSTILDGTSIWKDSLGKKVADARITISMRPSDERIVCGERYTNEGFVSEDYDIIREGILESFAISPYVANKKELKRASNSSFNMIIDPGSDSLADMIKNTSRGIIVGRFSGGQPGVNGEFSGVAKNSFLIENGVITCALSETMINGNLAEILKNVSAVSQETVCDGDSCLPYIAFGGITVSGK